MDVAKYIETALKLGADHAVEFKTEDIAFDSRTLLKCMFGCNDWGKGLTCPSREGSPTPWEYERIFKKYSGGILIHSTSKKISQQASFAVEREAFMDGFYFAFSLCDCSLCAECAGFRGKDCVNKSKSRPAFHSVGIDVFKTVRKFGLPLATLRDPSEGQNWYSAVFIE